MNRPQDNDLLRVASERVATHEGNARAFSLAGEALAALAFVAFCALLYVALYIGPVLP